MSQQTQDPVAYINDRRERYEQLAKQHPRYAGFIEWALEHAEERGQS